MASGLSLSATTSTGVAGNTVYFDSPVQTISMQTFGASTGAGTVLLEASLNGRNWTTVGTSTHSSDSATFTSTSANLITAARATLVTHTGGGAISAIIAGR